MTAVFVVEYGTAVGAVAESLLPSESRLYFSLQLPARTVEGSATKAQSGNMDSSAGSDVVNNVELGIVVGSSFKSTASQRGTRLSQ